MAIFAALHPLLPQCRYLFDLCVILWGRLRIWGSIRIKTEDLTNDYEYKYLGSLKIKKNNFKVIQQKILSGQYQDSQRAAVSIRLFLKGKLYGEFTGLNNFYKIKITSNTLCLYNYETKSRSIFELKDSIPNLLFFPYNDKDSLSSGDIFYFNRCQ